MNDKIIAKVDECWLDLDPVLISGMMINIIWNTVTNEIMTAYSGLTDFTEFPGQAKGPGLARDLVEKYCIGSVVTRVILNDDADIPRVDTIFWREDSTSIH